MKTKVIALRVTQEEYDALVVMAEGRLISQYVHSCLGNALDSGTKKLILQRKAADRKAKREAKKAAANGAQ